MPDVLPPGGNAAVDDAAVDNAAVDNAAVDNATVDNAAAEPPITHLADRMRAYGLRLDALLTWLFGLVWLWNVVGALAQILVWLFRLATVREAAGEL